MVISCLHRKQCIETRFPKELYVILLSAENQEEARILCPSALFSVSNKPFSHNLLLCLDLKIWKKEDCLNLLSRHCVCLFFLFFFNVEKKTHGQLICDLSVIEGHTSVTQITGNGLKTEQEQQRRRFASHVVKYVLVSLDCASKEMGWIWSKAFWIPRGVQRPLCSL